MVILLSFNWNVLAALSSFGTFAVSVFAAYYAFKQYRSQSKHTKVATRSKILADYNWHYMQNKSIQIVIRALLKKDFSKVQAYDIEIFMRFFEELYLLMHSENRMKKEISKYMFSYYAILAWDSENFWQRLSETTLESVESLQSAEDWTLFRKYVEEMRIITFNINSIKI